jgi:hypothetical protein
MKIPMTSSGVEPAAFRLILRCPIQLRYRVGGLIISNGLLLQMFCYFALIGFQ